MDSILIPANGSANPRHRHNNASGLRNPGFYPLRTPLPSLAVRRIVPTDLVFLPVENVCRAHLIYK